MPASVKQLRDNQNNFIYPKIAKEGLVEPINSNDVVISAINGIQSSTVQGALNELAGNNVEIVKTASGSVISVSDSADYRLMGLKLYGKSVQDGVPTPEAPVEIESAGDGGDVTTTICGAQLLNFNVNNSTTDSAGNFIYNDTSRSCVLFLPKSKIIQVTGNFSLLNSSAVRIGKFDVFPEIGTVGVRDTKTSNFSIEAEKDIYISFSFNPIDYENLNESFNEIKKSFMINFGPSSLPWEPYKSQTLTYPTPNGLPGIPVESGGNYTNEDGQQWYCDILDLSSGVYFQNVEYINAKDKEWRVNVSWSNSNGNCILAYYVTDAPYVSHVISNKLKAVTYSSLPSYYGEYEIAVHPHISTGNSVIYISIPSTVVGEATDEALATYLESAGIHILAPKAMTTQDIDISLTSDPLTTYKPNTTITTDSDPAAGIEVEYLTDSGVAEVLGYYASKDDLANKQDKLSGTTGQFVGFDAEGEAEAQEITAANVGAMPTVDGGTTGQYLRKTSDGQAWQDGPDLSGYATQSWVNGRGFLTAVPAEYVTDTELTAKGYATTADVAETYAPKALKFNGTFTAAGWTSATGGYSQTINVSGLTADDEPIIDLNSTATDADTFNGQLEAFGLVSNFTTGAGTLTAVVLGDSAPTVDIPIHGVVVY